MKVIKGNLVNLALAGKYDIIAHGCNCFNTMGAGIAATIKSVFPEAFVADCNTMSGDRNKLGNYSMAAVGNLLIFNLYSQYTYNPRQKPFDYEAFTLALRKMIWYCNELNGTKYRLKIGLPLIGCDLAGGELNRIIQIMHTETFPYKYTMDIDIVVFDQLPDANNMIEKIQTIIKTIE